MRLRLSPRMRSDQTRAHASTRRQQLAKLNGRERAVHLRRTRSRNGRGRLGAVALARGVLVRRVKPRARHVRRVHQCLHQRGTKGGERCHALELPRRLRRRPSTHALALVLAVAFAYSLTAVAGVPIEAIRWRRSVEQLGCGGVERRAKGTHLHLHT